MAKRIGPRMQEALAYIERNPGCAKLHAASALSGRYPGTSVFAYDVVNRLIRAGMVVARKGKGNAYALFVRADEGSK
jgi:DNA-binding IscR family transcriptional regulator